MRAAARRGDGVFYAEINDLELREDGLAVSRAQVQMRESDILPWLSDGPKMSRATSEFDAILMRKEPPVDSQFITATHLLERAGAPVINSPQALRDLNEKLAIFNFPDLILPTIVTADRSRIAKFYREHNNVVLKPLDGMGGGGVYAALDGDINFRSVLDTMTGGGNTAIMAQEFVAAKEDFRVFVVGGKPFGWMMRRKPVAGDFRANMAVGGAAEIIPLDSPHQKIAAAVGEFLAARGVVFAGLDIIGGRLCEINITCPTGLVPVREQKESDIVEQVLAAMTATN